MFGWAGKILYVDLTKGKIWKEPLSKELRMRFIGGRGVNLALLWELTRPGVEPLSPDNILIFGAGPLTGTTVPLTGRMTLTTKSPVTNLYVKSSMGGHFSGELKFAGYDHIIFMGCSKAPVYLWIQDETVELRNAEHLWGEDVRVTDAVIKRDQGDRDIRVASIGPAGENLVKYAAIMNSIYNAAARGGVGAVMGSKKLKAIAVRGTGSITVQNPERLNKAVLTAIKGLEKRWRRYFYGTSRGVGDMNDRYALPSYNFKTGYVENGHLISGPYFAEAGYLKRKHACFGCVVGCHLYNVVKEGPYAGYAVGPEYETCFALGSNVGVANTEALLKVNELCNIYGLDTISTGVTIAWAMESYERGVLKKEDTDGLDLRFGNYEALVKLIPMIAHREGKIGDLLAEGTKRAAAKVGGDSWKWALSNSKGLEISGVDTRTWRTRALSYSVNPRGPDHLFHQIWTTPDYVEKITGEMVARQESSHHYSHLPTSIGIKIVQWFGDHFAVTDSLGVCKFSGEVFHENEEAMSEVYSAVTGIETKPEEILFIGKRIYTLERCFNVREGFDRKLDDMPWRLMHEPADWPGISTAYKGLVNSPEDLNEMLDEYYKLRGWDLTTGWPLRDTMRKLGLEDFAEDLEKMGKPLPI